MRKFSKSNKYLLDNQKLWAENGFKKSIFVFFSGFTRSYQTFHNRKEISRKSKKLPGLIRLIYV